MTVAISGLRLVSRWFIGQQLGAAAVGQYGVAAMVAGAVLLAGSATSRVIMQYAARAVGAKMNRRRQTTQFALLPGIAIAGASAMACIGVAGLAEWIIPVWAPQHAAATSVLRPVLYASATLGVALVLASALRAQSRQRELLTSCALASVLQLGLLAIGAVGGFTLQGFAVLEIGSFAAFTAMLLRLLDCRRDQRMMFAACVASAVILCAGAIEISRQLIPPANLLAVVSNAALASLFFSPWFVFGYACARALVRDVDSSAQESGLSETPEPRRQAA